MLSSKGPSLPIPPSWSSTRRRHACAPIPPVSGKKQVKLVRVDAREHVGVAHRREHAIRGDDGGLLLVRGVARVHADGREREAALVPPSRVDLAPRHVHEVREGVRARSRILHRAAVRLLARRNQGEHRRRLRAHRTQHLALEPGGDRGQAVHQHDRAELAAKREGAAPRASARERTRAAPCPRRRRARPRLLRALQRASARACPRPPADKRARAELHRAPTARARAPPTPRGATRPRRSRPREPRARNRAASRWRAARARRAEPVLRAACGRRRAPSTGRPPRAAARACRLRRARALASRAPADPGE